MIRINLLGEKVDNSSAQFLQIVSFIGLCALTIAGLAAFHNAKSIELDSLLSEKSRLEARVAKLQNETKEVENIERKKRDLKMMLKTIATLKAKKHGPVHLLDEINKAVPREAWLTSIVERNGQVELGGFALDNQTIARMIANLDRSDYLVDDKVAPLQTKLEEVMIDDKVVKLTSFSISAQVENLLKLRAEKAGGTIQIEKVFSISPAVTIQPTVTVEVTKDRT